MLRFAVAVLPLMACTLTGCDGPDLPHAFAAGWRGEPVCEVLYEDSAMRVGRCVFAPGTGHEAHYHEAHFGYALTGGVMRIETDDGAREQEIPAGASWHSPARTQHRVLNVGDTTTSYLIVEAGR